MARHGAVPEPRNVYERRKSFLVSMRFYKGMEWGLERQNGVDGGGDPLARLVTFKRYPPRRSPYHRPR